MSTSDSEEERAHQHSQTNTAANAEDGPAEYAEDGPAAIVICSSDDDDDIWLRPPAVQTTPAPPQSAPAPRTAELRRTR